MVKILIVEDEAVVAHSIKNRCEMLGYSVPAIVASGDAVSAIAKSVEPDLILMDVRLQGSMDGITAAEKLREEMDVPVVYITAYVDDETIEKAKMTEPYGYIVKPFSFADMKANIEIALHKFRMEKIRNLNE
jgi:two-component system, response regulator PdtaR